VVEVVIKNDERSAVSEKYRCFCYWFLETEYSQSFVHLFIRFYWFFIFKKIASIINYQLSIINYQLSMNISVELTLSPLQDTFEEHIITFIKKLRASGLTVLENPLSTQVYGEYDEVMNVLHKEIKETFELIDKGLLYMKIVKSDRSEYEPHF